MSVATLRRPATKARRMKTAPWKRPTDWPLLPAVNVGEQKMVALYAVYDHDSNFCVIQAAGAYTVDWGDGSAPENVASGVTALHNYVYANVPGAATSEGFKCAVITLTMQGAANLTTLDLARKHTQVGLASNYSSGWLDVRVAGANITSLVPGLGTNVVQPRMLRQFEFVGTHSIAAANGTNMFSTCTALESVILPRAFTAGFTSLSGFFTNCPSLKTIPMLDTGACTNFSSMFNGCSSLVSIPLLDTHLGTNVSLMFQNCFSLETIPLLDTSAATNMGSMFASCVVLKSIPLLDTHLNTSFTSMFQSCNVLKTIPAINTAAGTLFNSMFQACGALVSVPTLNTSAGTNFANMFSGCSSLNVIPALDTAAASSAANVSGMFATCTSLSKSLITGMKYAHTYPGKFSAAELNRIYTNLAAASGAQAITVTGNWGVAGDDPTIATAKGWTVTGS